MTAAKQARDPSVTPEMLAAGMQAWDRRMKEEGPCSWPDMMEAVYLAMRAARSSEEDQSAEPDWFWCDIDPDEAGYSAYEAMFYHRGRLVPVELHSSYVGPDLWGVMAPALPDGDDDSDTAHTFNTREEAEAFCRERMAIAATTGSDT